MSKVARTLTALAAVTVGLAGIAQAETLWQDRFETATTPGASIPGWFQNGGWYPYGLIPGTENAGYNNSVQGVGFGYYTPGSQDTGIFGDEATGTIPKDQFFDALTFEPNMTYTLSALVTDGSSVAGGILPMELGYLLGLPNNPGFAQPLALRESDNIPNTWTPVTGATYTTPADGPMIGQPIRIYFPGRKGIVLPAVYSDVWFDNVTLTKTPATGPIVSGNAILQGLTSTTPIYVYVVPTGAQLETPSFGSYAIFTRTNGDRRYASHYVVFPDPVTGAYSFRTNQTGVFDLVFDGATFVTKRFSGVTLGVSTSLPSFTLMNGDVDGDNDVDIDDYDILANAYGSFTGDPNFNAKADLDSDGDVDIDDYDILASGYGSFGD